MQAKASPHGLLNVPTPPTGFVQPTPSRVQTRPAAQRKAPPTLQRKVATHVNAPPAWRGAGVIQRASTGVATATSLASTAKAIHLAAKGDPSQSTTGVARLKNGTLVVATQLSLEAVQGVVEAYGISPGNVMKTLGAGYHTEVSLYIKYGSDISAIGASQGFCPHCQQFLTAKSITMDGPPRSTRDQVWRSPEYYKGEEKAPTTAPYPWVYFRDELEGKRFEFATREEFRVWEAARLGK